jgi:hypothetical protein
MSNNITPHLFITSNYELINKLYFGINKSFKSVLDNLSEEEIKSTILVSKGNNNNLVSFEHTFGYPGDMISGMQLELIDIDGGLNEMLASLSFYPLILKKLYNSAKLNVSGMTTNSLNSLLDSSSLTIAQTDIYFMYGTSDDMKQWSGPYHSVLADVVQKYTSEGIRSIELSFTTSTENFHINYTSAKEKNSLSEKVNRFSRLYLNGYGGSISVARIIDQNLPLTSEFNVVIHDMVTEYLKRCTSNNNVIVLLPNISIALMNEYAPFILKGLNSSNTSPLEARRQYSTFISESLRKFGISVNKVINRKTFATPFQDGRVETNEENEEMVSISINASLALTTEFSNDHYTSFTDYYIPLQKLENGYRAIRPEEPKNLIFYEETDIRIINLLWKHKIIPENNKSVVIFGDSNIIDYLVYLNTSIVLKDFSDLQDIVNLKNIPNSVSEMINKTDFDIFSLDYRKDFFDTFYKDFPNNNYYKNTISDDELAFIDEKRSNIPDNTPIFRCNIANGNVTGFRSDIDVNGMLGYMNGVRLKQDNLISTALSSLTEELLSRETSEAFKSEIQNSLAFFSTDSSLYKRRGAADIYKDLVNSLDKVYTMDKNIKDFDSKKIAKIMVKILYLNAILNNGPSVEVENDNGSKLSSMQNKILNYMYGYIANINIRTIPMFNLGSLAINRLHVLFLMGRNKVAGSKVLLSDLLGYSGWYYISGYKHVINNTDVYSEFILGKETFKSPEIPEVLDSELDKIITNIDIKKEQIDTFEKIWFAPQGEDLIFKTGNSK